MSYSRIHGSFEKLTSRKMRLGIGFTDSWEFTETNIRILENEQIILIDDSGDKYDLLKLEASKSIKNYIVIGEFGEDFILLCNLKDMTVWTIFRRLFHKDGNYHANLTNFARKSSDSLFVFYIQLDVFYSILNNRYLLKNEDLKNFSRIFLSTFREPIAEYTNVFYDFMKFSLEIDFE